MYIVQKEHVIMWYQQSMQHIDYVKLVHCFTYYFLKAINSSLNRISDRDVFLFSSSLHKKIIKNVYVFILYVAMYLCWLFTFEKSFGYLIKQVT